MTQFYVVTRVSDEDDCPSTDPKAYRTAEDAKASVISELEEWLGVVEGESGLDYRETVEDGMVQMYFEDFNTGYTITRVTLD